MKDLQDSNPVLFRKLKERGVAGEIALERLTPAELRELNDAGLIQPPLSEDELRRFERTSLK